MNMTLPKVDQNEIGRFYKNLLENPAAYAERPVVIWRSYFQDGILFPIQLHVNIEHNKDREKEDRDFLRLKCLHLESLKDKDAIDIFNPSKHKGFVLYVDIQEDSFQNPEPYDVNSSSLVSDWLKKIMETAKVSVILHLPFFEHPDTFEGMDVKQYIYQPDFEEWKRTESKSKNPLTNLLIGFIDSAGSREKKDYSWYWYFHRCSDWKPEMYFPTLHEGTGCDFPSCWLEGVDKLWRYIHLPMAQIPKNYKPRKDIRISDIPIETFKSFFDKGISDDLIQSFRDYLMDNGL